jgi:Holliday junction resolvase RusA-like endonuclease
VSEIEFTVYGNPVAKARSRTVRKPNGFTHSYTPKKTVDYEALVAKHAVESMRGIEKLKGALYAEFLIFMPIPNSWTLRKKALAKSFDILPTSKPDTSNIVKSLEDAMNNIVYQDDSQIVDYYAQKRYAEVPKVVIKIREVSK